MEMTTIEIRRDVSKLIKEIAKKRSEKHGAKFSKGDVVRALVLQEAQALGLWKMPKKGKK